MGLTGSTEWGEQFADELRKKAVAYINVDEATSGPNFHGQAVASLAPMLVETTHTLQDPSGKSLYEAWKESSARERQEAKRTEDVTRRKSRRHPHRQRLRPHRVPQLRRHARPRPAVRRSITASTTPPTTIFSG